MKNYHFTAVFQVKKIYGNDSLFDKCSTTILISQEDEVLTFNTNKNASKPVFQCSYEDVPEVLTCSGKKAHYVWLNSLKVRGENTSKAYTNVRGGIGFEFGKPKYRDRLVDLLRTSTRDRRKQSKTWLLSRINSSVDGVKHDVLTRKIAFLDNDESEFSDFSDDSESSEPPGKRRRYNPRSGSQQASNDDRGLDSTNELAASINEGLPIYEEVALPTSNEPSTSDVAIKLHVGPNKKLFRVFSWQLNPQCNLLSSINSDTGNTSFHLDANPDHFEVFINWLYDKKLPTNLFPSIQHAAINAEENSHDVEASYRLMNNLYGMAHTIGAQTFKNILMDAFCNHMSAVSTKHFRIFYFTEAVKHTMLHEYYVQKMVHTLGDHDGDNHDDYKAIMGNGQEHAVSRIYSEILLRRLRHISGPNKNMKWEGSTFHEHSSASEVCYSNECCEIRKEQGLKIQPTLPPQSILLRKYPPDYQHSPIKPEPHS